MQLVFAVGDIAYFKTAVFIGHRGFIGGGEPECGKWYEFSLFVYNFSFEGSQPLRPGLRSQLDYHQIQQGEIQVLHECLILSSEIVLLGKSLFGLSLNCLKKIV